MSPVTVWFIRCALIYFLLAILLGLHMAVTGLTYPVMPIHVHFNLLGWMSMMVFGVGYHILPRFSGKPLWSDRLSYLQLWTANIGLLGMAAGWYLKSGGAGTPVLVIFSVIEALSILFFAINMLKTIKITPPPPAKPAAVPTPVKK